MRDSASEQNSLRPVLLAAAALTLFLAGLVSSTASAAQPAQRLTLEQRKDLKQRAIELNNAGFQLYQEGEIARALEKMKEALQLCERLYPKSEYPGGDPHLAASPNNLGSMLQDQGSYVEARGFYDRGLAMCQALYPKERYPDGHPDLANSLNNLGDLLEDQGAFAEARAFL